MGDLSVIFFTFSRRNLCLKSQNKIKPQSHKQKSMDNYGPPVFAPDYIMPLV